MTRSEAKIFVNTYSKKDVENYIENYSLITNRARINSDSNSEILLTRSQAFNFIRKYPKDKLEGYLKHYDVIEAYAYGRYISYKTSLGNCGIHSENMNPKFLYHQEEEDFYPNNLHNYEGPLSLNSHYYVDTEHSHRYETTYECIQDQLSFSINNEYSVLSIEEELVCWFTENVAKNQLLNLSKFDLYRIKIGIKNAIENSPFNNSKEVSHIINCFETPEVYIGRIK